MGYVQIYILMRTMFRYIEMGTMFRYILMGPIFRYILMGTMFRYILMRTIFRYILMGTMFRYILMGTLLRYFLMGNHVQIYPYGNLDQIYPNRNHVQIYPDENHGLLGVLPHLFSLMEDFLLSTLGNSTIVFPEDVTYTLSDMLTNQIHTFSLHLVKFNSGIGTQTRYIQTPNQLSRDGRAKLAYNRTGTTCYIL